MGPVMTLVTGGGDPRTLAERVGAAARAGIHLVQVRERELDDRALFSEVTVCLDAVKGTMARVVVNDRLDVALAARAHGVHLRSDSIHPRRVRALAPRGFLVGRSVHDAGDIVALTEAGGVDYFVFGTVFRSASKPGRSPAGIDGLARAAAATPVPVLAIGGITPTTLPGVRAAGAAGFAAISLFAGSGDDVAVAVREARLAFDRPEASG